MHSHSTVFESWKEHSKYVYNVFWTKISYLNFKENLFKEFRLINLWLCNLFSDPSCSAPSISRKQDCFIFIRNTIGIIQNGA